MALKIKKLDLHVHTPASHDFLDKSITPEQIIEKAIAVGLDAIAITDHNSADWIDNIKKVAKEKNFTVFPGMEISCGGAERGSIHVIGIFDVDKNKDDLQKVLGKLDVKRKGKDSLTSKSVFDVINIIREKGGLSVLAHANSTKGALSDIRGNPRKDIIKNPNLLAVEATEGDFKKDKGKRLLDVLSSKSPIYERRLAVYMASDNKSPNSSGHCLESIGELFTFFQMEELKLESLRECFEDPYTRIIQSYEIAKIQSKHPRILKAEIKGGFLDGQKFYFHSGINSIIGGTGTGKSLIIEFLRFAFNKKPDTQSLWQDHKSKIEKRLGIGSSIIVSFRDQEGDEYELTRECILSKDFYDSPIKCFNKSAGREFGGNINSIFPLLIYSQNEILEITQDPTSQLKLLDSFRVGLKKYQTSIEEINTKLSKLDHELNEAINQNINIDNLKKDLETITEKLSKIEKKIKSEVSIDIAKTFLKLDRERSDALVKLDEYDQMIVSIDQLITKFKNRTLTKNANPLINKIESELIKEHSLIIKTLEKIKEHIRDKKGQSLGTITAWEKFKKFKKIEEQYNKALKTKKQNQSIEAQRRELKKEEKEIRGKITSALSIASQIKKLRKERDDLLKDLIAIHESYFKERAQQVELVNQRSGGKLNIKITPADDVKKYKENLQKLKVHSYAEAREIEEIVKKISPIYFVNLVLDNKIKEITNLVKINKEKAESIVRVLMSPINLQRTLALQYESYPDDRVEIFYQKKDNRYYPLSELSMGQKADALIMIALGDSVMPVIIDQPEDALDIPSIWTDVCAKLRMNKHTRQFIFTTHNSSIAVSSDSDEYIVMEAKADKGWISETGSIDKEKIKKEVIGHLEGGPKSYDLKRRKYGL